MEYSFLYSSFLMFDLFDEATNLAFQAMDSKITFALTLQKHGSDIFDDYSETFESLDGDLQEELGILSFSYLFSFR